MIKKSNATNQHRPLLYFPYFTRQFNLESASNVAKSLNALCKKGTLRKETEAYVFEDVLFGRWQK